MAKYHMKIELADKCLALDINQYAAHPVVLWQGSMIMPPAGKALAVAWHPEHRALHFEYAPSEMYKDKMEEWMRREDVRVVATAAVVARGLVVVDALEQPELIPDAILVAISLDLQAVH